jgi:hypothetical protein
MKVHWIPDPNNGFNGPSIPVVYKEETWSRIPCKVIDGVPYVMWTNASPLTSDPLQAVTPADGQGGWNFLVATPRAWTQAEIISCMSSAGSSLFGAISAVGAAGACGVAAGPAAPGAASACFFEVCGYLGLAAGVPGLFLSCNEKYHYVNTSADLEWSWAGPIAGKHCVQFLEPVDPHFWNDNYLCSSDDLGMKWSYAGPIQGMRCTQIIEGADPHTWSDNYLCVPHDLPYAYSWSSAGPISGETCVKIDEPTDPDTWNDNFLCYGRRRIEERADRKTRTTLQ